MSEFHRIVTYLYLYEGGHKSRNAGYAKIEKRDAQCRVEIHMKNTGYNNCDCPVYFYTQNQEQFEGISIGTASFTCGNSEFKEILDVAVLSGVKGIFLPLSEGQMIVSQWDDTPFDRNLFTVLPSSDEINSPVEISSPIEVNSPTDTGVTDNCSTDAISDLRENIPDIDLKAAEAAPLFSTPEPSEQQPARLDFLMENFPPIIPFSMENSSRWIKLELKDLRLLPEPYRFLANNSFLLHGFFNYHHLILGKSTDAASTHWTLGIPGVFQNPERVMAALFGFSDFQSAAESDCKTGHFGYWLRPLE